VSPQQPAAAPTLDVAGFEPPFEHIPIARAFIAQHRIAKISIHELEPGTTTARSSEITEYNAEGAPVHRYERSGIEAPVLVERVAYTREDAQPAGPAAERLLEKLVVLDSSGRIAKVHMRRGAASALETRTYDAAGNLTRVAREVHGEGTVTHQEELRTYAAGRLIKRTRGDMSAAPFETLEFSYDAHGRFAEWRGSKPGFKDDRYAFTYGPADQLASMQFQEGDKPIYRRDYIYDADGFLMRIELKAAVPAMNDATYVLAYELANGQQRQAMAVSFPAPAKSKTDADILASLRQVFPAAADGAVRWGSFEGRRYLDTITFQLPAVELGSVTEEQLKDKACALRQALGFEGCDCEYLELGSTRGGATLVTFHAMLGC
jgi:hypothetical protein